MTVQKEDKETETEIDEEEEEEEEDAKVKQATDSDAVVPVFTPMVQEQESFSTMEEHALFA